MKYSPNQVIDFLRKQKKLFKKEFKVKRIGVFGSYARGDVHGDSDIDIVVELEKPDLFYMIGIKQALEEALGHKVDIVRLRKNMNSALKARIKRDVVYV